ncbi:MAG TPA: HEAT repeat domain-containing protein [Spirochaetes bacterium]|nr:HEAT repeat domain-containing protein [Spirochaetota bacterium]
MAYPEDRRLNGADLRRRVGELLSAEDGDALYAGLADITPARLVGPLSSYLGREPALKWRAVTALGWTVAKLADESPEGGRTAVRRFIWMLNDESGGIPWGAPEAVGEILARSELLGKEFHHILVSYVLEEDDGLDNHLEYTPLRRGAWWGVGRLCQARPGLVSPAAGRLYAQGRKETDPEITGLLCWALGSLRYRPAERFLSGLGDDGRHLDLYRDRSAEPITIGELAREALRKMELPAG